MSVFAKLSGFAAPPHAKTASESRPRGPVFTKGYGVGDSEDLRRILALPTRERPDDLTLAQWGKTLKALYGTGATSCECVSKYRRGCCSELLPVQSWALMEAKETGGILGPIGVGHGKTLLDLLVGLVVEAKVIVLLLPPNLKKQLVEVDWHYYAQHWKMPNLAGGRWLAPGRPTLHVVAFSELSGSRSTDLLHRLRPDVVVCDEAHSVRNRTAARTKRFLRYFNDANVMPRPRLFAWSGTLTSKSLKDYAHLSHYALREGSPAPAHWPTVEEWASALDPSDCPTAPGRLERLGTPVREGFQRRLVSTRGVISSGDSASCQASLIISEREVQVPAKVQAYLDDTSKSWARPDGEELIDAMSVGRCLRELSCGFFYRWRWPRGEPVAVIERWLAARKDWHKELREKLKVARPHMDSPLLLAKAAIRWYEGYTHVKRDEEGKEVGREVIPPKSTKGPLTVWPSLAWPEWERVRDSAKPETEAIWLDDWLVKDSVEWLREGPGLLWYEFDAFGRAVYRAANGAVFAGPGEDGDRRVISLCGTESVVTSIRAHGTGKNLQHFARNLVANPPSDGATWEQLLGRTHRQGQLADEVTVDVYRHTEPMKQAVDKARDLAAYIEGTFGASQRLASKATWRF